MIKIYLKEKIDALKQTILDIENYIQKNPNFKTIGKRMCECFKFSLENKTVKELPNELTRTWS